MTRTAPLLLKPVQPVPIMLDAFVSAMLNLGHKPEELIRALEAKTEVMRHLYPMRRE